MAVQRLQEPVSGTLSLGSSVGHACTLESAVWRHEQIFALFSRVPREPRPLANVLFYRGARKKTAKNDPIFPARLKKGGCIGQQSAQPPYKNLGFTPQ